MKIKTNSKMKNLLVLLGAILAVATLLVAPVVADTGVTELPTVSGTYYLENDIYINKTWTISSGQEIILDLNGHNITMTKSKRVIDVKRDANLTITDKSVGEQGKITGGSDVNEGGCVFIDYGSFTLEGGNITGNTANERGGGVYVSSSSSSFTMSGGNITGNTAGNTEGYGGGVYIASGSFTLEGGNITGNTAKTNGGGVNIHYGSFTQKGGNITGNSADYGGGVLVYYGSFTQNGGTITSNSAHYSGGGVLCTYGSTSVLYDGTIAGNTAGYGGGVCIEAGSFTQKGGTITGNNAGYSGGVYVLGGTFTLSGGTVTCNTADYGGGVYVSDGTFAISGNIKVEDNTANNVPSNVYLLSGKIIKISSSPYYDSSIGVTTEKVPTKDAPVKIVNSIITATDDSYFFADNTSYSIEKINNALYLVLIDQVPDDKIHVNITLGQHMTVEKPATRNQYVNPGNPIIDIIINADYGYYFGEVTPQEYGLYYNISEDKHTMFISGVPKSNIVKTLEDALLESVDPVVSTNLSLQAGWNFISVPKYLDSSCDTVEELFAGLNTKGISLLGYDPTQPEGWYTLTKDTKIEPLNAYWVYAEDPFVIYLKYLNDLRKLPPTKTVYKGWNAVGICAETSISAKSSFSNLNWVNYLPWDVLSGRWGVPIIKGGSAENSEDLPLYIGNGGWLYVESDGTMVGSTR